MGGKEACRGFLYQGFASVVKALTDESEWDKIYVEFPTTNDKVDIALESNNKIIKCIQVKSTVNNFSKSNIKTWLEDLIKDYKSPRYELFLIGQCEGAVNKFCKSIEKYCNGEIDHEVENLLQELDERDIKFLDNNIISFSILPFKLDILETIIRDSLHRYISYHCQSVTFEQIRLIASSMVNEQMISATSGKGMSKSEFDEELQKKIFVTNGYSFERKSIGIKSFLFQPRILNSEDNYNCLSLLENFEGRNIKKDYDWTKDIYKKMEKFLAENINSKCAYKLFLEAHISIAFAAGRILNSKSGINIFPMQKSAVGGVELLDIKPMSKRKYSKLCISHDLYNDKKYDSALVLSITAPIYNHVLKYIEENNLPIGHIINCIPNQGATHFSIEDGTHAADLVESICKEVSERKVVERRATLHIFASAPNAFMFFLGRNSMGFGKCILYEYDFEQKESCSYSVSMKFD